MKPLSTTLALLACTLQISRLVSAQRANIGFPADGATIARGTNFTVEVDRPDTLSSSQEVAIVIAIQSCPESDCVSADDFMGTVLYSGSFNPQFSNPSDRRPPHQNFTIQIPSTPNMKVGRAQLGLAHFSLIGAGLAPFMETNTVSINLE